MTDGFVRAARAADAADVAQVQAACWREGYAGLVPGRILGELTCDEAIATWQERWLEAIVSPPSSRHRVLVAVEGEPAARTVAGFAAVGPATDEDRWPGTDGQLYELRIRPDRTGHGHGGRLLHAAADTLAEDGFHISVAWTLEADTAFRAFLESSGWAPDGARAELDVGVMLPAIRLQTRISAQA